jgi:hypothetical protein
MKSPMVRSAARRAKGGVVYVKEELGDFVAPPRIQTPAQRQ